MSDIRRVLIVDDNHDSAELLSVLLEREGHETRVAYDGPRALLVAAQFRPNIAFLDIGLPGMDGYELMSALRGQPETSGCKFVAVTGYEELRPAAKGQPPSTRTWSSRSTWTRSCAWWSSSRIAG